MSNGRELYLNEIQKIKYENLCDVLSGYEQRGIRVSVQGVELPVTKSAEIMSVHENACYMPDIIMDNVGKIVEINYDRVSLT